MAIIASHQSVPAEEDNDSQRRPHQGPNQDFGMAPMRGTWATTTMMPAVEVADLTFLLMRSSLALQ